MPPKNLKKASDFRSMPATVSYGEWRNQIAQAIEDTVAAFGAIDNKARREGRELLASENRDVQALMDERVKLEGILTDLDTEIEENGVPGREMFVRGRSGWTNGHASMESPGAPGGDGARGWSVGDSRTDWAADGVPIPSTRSVAEWVAERTPSDHGPDLDFGKCLRGIVTGEWRDAEAERRAMSEGVLSAGGYMVPAPLSAQVIDLARPKTRVLAAGAQLVPMSSKTLDVAKWTGDPSSAWHSESAVIAPSDATLGSVRLEARALASTVRASRELLEDAQGVQDRLLEAFAEKFALTIDYAAMYGSGTAPEPRGVKNTTGITVQSMGVNGLKPTNYTFLVDAIGALQDNNEEPNAAILAPRTERTIAGFQDSTNQPLRPPDMVAKLPRSSTTQVPINLTVGTSTDTSDVFTADWSQLLIGIRTQLQIQVLTERYADTGELAFLAWWRGDIAVARPKAFAVTTGVRP